MKHPPSAVGLAGKALAILGGLMVLISVTGSDIIAALAMVGAGLVGLGISLYAIGYTHAYLRAILDLLTDFHNEHFDDEE